MAAAEASPTDVALKRAQVRHARQQKHMRKTMLQRSQLEQYAEALNVPAPALASTYLDHLLSRPGNPYLRGSNIEEAAVDAALVRIRAAGSTGVPEEAEAARKWLHPVLDLLAIQAAEEYAILSKALAEYLPLLTPERTATPAGPAPPAANHEVRESAETKATRMMAEFLGNAEKVGFNYMQLPPPSRLPVKSIMLFPGRIAGAIVLPAWSEVLKGGRAGDLYPGQEEEISFFRAAVSGLYLRYCGPAPEDAVECADDSFATKLLVAVDEAGTLEERLPDLDRSALSLIDQKLDYPLNALTDKAARSAACASLWGQLQSELSRIGKGTMTCALLKVARCEVFAEAAQAVRAQTNPTTPAGRQTGQGPAYSAKKARGGPSDSGGGSSDKSAESATGWPSGQCFKWCKSGDCEFATMPAGASSSTSPSCAKYGHDPAHKAKSPNAVMPPSRK